MGRSVEQPAGFPRCRACPLLQSGTSTVCYRCAQATFERVAYPCPVCTRDIGEPGDRCGNPLCGDSSRSIERIDAVAVKTGPIESRIKRLKYAEKRGWAAIFGRIVLGYLEEHRHPDEFDLIVANPTFTGAGGDRTVPHTELVIEAAAEEDLFDQWPFDTSDPRAIIKTGPSPKSAALGTNYWSKVAAADALLDVLQIPNPRRTRDARILVYDDVCTTGHQLDRVARVLQEIGRAKRVEGLVLARAPYRRR